MKIFYLIAVFLSLQVHSQTASIKFNNTISLEYPDEWDTFVLNINGDSFYPTDTLNKRMKINKRKLDKCYAVIGTDTLFFLAKFRKDNQYVVRAGCCCASFTLEAEDDTGRGTATFNNKTDRDLSFIVAEANIDTIAAGKKTTMFASESAMCYFKPCPILITETAYNDSKYDYHPGKENDESLDAEQTKLIKNAQWFHFLHREKLSIDYDDTTGKSTLTIDGYLTKEEYESFFNR